MNELGKHFAKKILDIHSEIENGTSLADNDDGEFQCDDYIEYSVNIPSFEALSENDVYNLIMNSKKKSSYLDPVPTDLLMKCLDVLPPVITKIINISLDTGCFPNDWKEAIILPILKKAGLESSFDNLRPISNLAYISKLIERAVYNQIAILAMENCISDLWKWMLKDKLKLNDGKTEFLMIGSKQQLQKLSRCHVSVGSVDIFPVQKACNLGVWCHSHFSFKTHLFKSAFSI